MLTLTAFGTFLASLNKSSEANLHRRMTKSKEGPTSSSSTRGIFVPDFFSRILHNYQIERVRQTNYNNSLHQTEMK